MKSGLSAIPFDTLFEVDIQQRTRGHTWPNIEVIWTFGNTSSLKGLLTDGINWNKQTLTVEASMVSRTNYKESGRRG